MGLRDKNKRFYLECECGCGILEFERWYWDNSEDNSLDLTYYVRVNDVNWFSSLKKRIGHAWKILIGKDALIWNIAIDEKEMDKFKEFINSI